jgi:ATP synthase protein I
VDKQREPRPGLAVAFELASKVTTIALGFSVPAVIGFGLDHWWGSAPVATLLGVCLGFASGMYQTLRLARENPGGARRGAGRSPEDQEKPAL